MYTYMYIYKTVWQNKNLGPYKMLKISQLQMTYKYMYFRMPLNRANVSDFHATIDFH